MQKIIEGHRKWLIGDGDCFADLGGVDLSGADLRGSNLLRANLSGADLRGANLSGVDLRGTDLSGVISDERTIWPEGFELSNV